MPAWVEQGTEEYSKRIRGELGFNLIEIPLATRGKSGSPDQYRAKEAKGILARIKSDDFVVTLDVKGRQQSTEQLASRLQDLKSQGLNLSLIIGGPDGLDQSCSERASDSWSLSALTLPHTIARIMVVEQLYRANSILQGHPYHRA
jgi:23S rRNA (pseudouridine1915-N3)-methyltransferase